MENNSFLLIAPSQSGMMPNLEGGGGDAPGVNISKNLA